MQRMDYFLELYGGLPRAGPGDAASTRRALAMVGSVASDAAILDLGCGPGAQTLELLRGTPARVTAVDLLPQMIARTAALAERAGLSERLELIAGDVREIGFAPGSFRVVWSEGAIYFLGFEAGLGRLRTLVEPGGAVAVSEPVWLEPDPPDELVAFWREYPEIDRIEYKLRVIASLGYESVGHFVLPRSSWTEEYYGPLAARLAQLEPGWAGIADAQSVLAEARTELDMFERYSHHYGYAFFVMRKPTR